jgi:hypothetical protein
MCNDISMIADSRQFAPITREDVNLLFLFGLRRTGIERSMMDSSDHVPLQLSLDTSESDISPKASNHRSF